MVNSVCYSYCLWMDAEEMGSHGCEKQKSASWDRTPCVSPGTCNKPCRAEGFDSGECKNLFNCICYKNCSCEKQKSASWDRTTCVSPGTCNKPCRAVGFDSGQCKNL